MVKRFRSTVCATLVTGAVTASLLSGCAPTKPELTPSAEGVVAAQTVHAIDNRYEPKTVRIKRGEAVTWVMSGSAKHDVVARDGSFVSPLERTGTFTHVFDTPGEYEYICSVHPEMTGKVIVE